MLTDCARKNVSERVQEQCFGVVSWKQKSVTCVRKRRNIKGSDVSSAERACEAFIKKVKVKECK